MLEIADNQAEGSKKTVYMSDEEVFIHVGSLLYQAAQKTTEQHFQEAEELLASALRFAEQLPEQQRSAIWAALGLNELKWGVKFVQEGSDDEATPHFQRALRYLNQSLQISPNNPTVQELRDNAAFLLN